MNWKCAIGLFDAIVTVCCATIASQHCLAADPSALQSLARPAGTITAATVVTDQQYQWLLEKTRQVTASVRHKWNDGTIAYTPGGVYDHYFPRDCYYLVSGARAFVAPQEIREMVRFIFRHQAAEGTVPQCIGPNEGNGYSGGLPVGDSAQFVVLLAYEYFERSSDRAFVNENLVKLKRAMDSIPRDKLGLVWIDPKNPVVAYGFTDCVIKTGSELFCSLLYWEASKKLADMARAVGNDAIASDLMARATLIEKNLKSLWDESSGMYLAASQDCRQIDIWGNAYSVYIGFPDVSKRQRICRYLIEHYSDIIHAGQVRHLPAGQYWAKTGRFDQNKPVPRDTYQNGAYWGTAAGWVAYAIAKNDPALASRMLGDLIDYYRTFDAYECVTKDPKNPTGCKGYAASLGNPLAAIHKLREEVKTGIVPAPK